MSVQSEYVTVILKKKRSFRGAWRSFSSKAYKFFWTKPCPSCGAIIEKSSGCDHMTCSRCRCEFCFSCGRKTGETHGLLCGQWPTMFFLGIGAVVFVGLEIGIAVPLMIAGGAILLVGWSVYSLVKLIRGKGDTKKGNKSVREDATRSPPKGRARRRNSCFLKEDVQMEPL